ncbi:PglZ domain-containing protein [candidate division KSB1 bacterium]|nr:PglZ domain-containing protein [candidate division KSB1 bacterium]
MKKVNEFISAYLLDHIREYGIVLWYDPEQLYTEMLNDLTLPNVPVFIYEGSFLKLRYNIETLLAGEKKPNMLIYINLARNETEYAMIEAESAGCYLMPGHPERKFNTRLVNIARQMLEPILPGQIDDITQKIEQGIYDLKDVNRLAQSGYSSELGTLKLLYDKNDPLEILYEFIIHPERDEKLAAKNALNELKKVAVNHGGMVLKSETASEIREELFRFLLVNDFILSGQLQKVPDILINLFCAGSESAVTNISKLAEMLRQRTPGSPIYQQTAENLEQTYHLDELDVPVDALVNVHTFPFVEKRLLHYAYDLLLDNRIDDLEKHYRQRHNSYWGQLLPFMVQWEWLRSVIEFLKITAKINNDLKAKKWSPEKLIEYYTGDESAWYLFEQYFQELEIGFLNFDSVYMELPDVLEKCLAKIRTEYSEVLFLLSITFQEGLEQNDFVINSILPHTNVFSNKVHPFLKEKVAFIQVDALRYDMAVILRNMLQEHHETELLPIVAQLPTITPVGMAASLPAAEQHIALTRDTQGRTGLQINNTALFSREDRKNYLLQSMEKAIFWDTKLQDIQSPRKQLREQIDKAGFIWITSQDIDALGENIQPNLARPMMRELLNDLRRGVQQLFKMGIQRVVITSDHGFLFGTELDPGNKVDAPGGNTCLLHRRVWIGQGGASHDSYIRVNENQLGLSGDLELVFPRGIACFKAPGGNDIFFHGGISLQEMVIPVLSLTKPKPVTTTGDAMFRVSMEKKEITNRFFTLQIRYETADLFLPDTRRVHLDIEYDKKPVGQIVTASYGLDPRSGDILLEKNKDNSIAVMLNEPIPPTLDLILSDTETLAVLSKTTKIPVKLLI